MDVSDMIVSMLHIKKYVLALIAYYFITRKSVSKEIEHIKEIQRRSKNKKTLYVTRFRQVFHCGKRIWKIQ